MDVFPSLPGLAWSVMKAARFASRSQKSVSGRVLKVLDQALPIWTFTLKHDLLRDNHDMRGGAGFGSSFDELRTLYGFFLNQQGSFNEFLYDDPTDNSVTAQGITIGDGTSATFQLVRTFGAFVEPVTDFNTIGAIYYDGVAQVGPPFPFSAGPTDDPGLLTDIRGPVPPGVAVTADFTYYFRCRFVDDNLEFENLMYRLWQQGGLKFESVLR